MSKKKQVIVIGLGRFGMSVLKELSKYDCDVMAIDERASLVDEASEFALHVAKVNAMDRENLEELDIKDNEVPMIVVAALGNDGKIASYSNICGSTSGFCLAAPGTDVYEGMIVGECNKELDLSINVVTAKQQTNTRSSNKDTTVVLKKPRTMSLEICLEYINEDELVEITPKNIRLRKKILDTAERKKFDSKRRNIEG